jgi:hypothetical protein
MSLVNVVLGLAVIVLGVLAAFQNYQRREAASFNTPYQVVLLTNGQAYFGKLQRFGSAYPTLTDVLYIQSQVDQQTKRVTNTLVKRGKELHAPDRMFLNAKHILFVEPVTPDSSIAKLIEEVKSRP